MDMHLFFHGGELLPALQAALVSIETKVDNMAGELDELRASVERGHTVVDSAVTLLNGLKDKLDEAIASGDPQALHALSAELGAQQARLASAVQENTPTEAPAPEPAPSPEPPPAPAPDDGTLMRRR